MLSSGGSFSLTKAHDFVERFERHKQAVADRKQSRKNDRNEKFKERNAAFTSTAESQKILEGTANERFRSNYERIFGHT